MSIEQATEIIREHLKARGLPSGIVDRPSQPAPEIIDPLAVRLSVVLRDESLPESERVRLRQIVSLVLADRRRS